MTAAEWLGSVARFPILMAVAHPEDETVSAGGILSAATADLLLCFTDGAPDILHDAHAADCATRREYSALRRRKLSRATRSAGLALAQQPNGLGEFLPKPRNKIWRFELNAGQRATKQQRWHWTTMRKPIVDRIGVPSIGSDAQLPFYRATG